MKAIVVSQYGDIEVLKFQDVEKGKPAKGQVLVNLKATGVNFVEIYQRKGTFPKKIPYIPGSEAAGVVEEVGQGVTDFKPGDRVAYVHEQGAYAEASVIRAESLIPLPPEFSFEEGAAFPLQGMTAHYLLHEFHKIKPGDVVLIHAAAGGMGLLLVQWAKHLGARVMGTVSTQEKAKIAREAGADEVILYTQQNFVEETKHLTNGNGANFIIDGVGQSKLAGNFKAPPCEDTLSFMELPAAWRSYFAKCFDGEIFDCFWWKACLTIFESARDAKSSPSCYQRNSGRVAEVKN